MNMILVRGVAIAASLALPTGAFADGGSRGGGAKDAPVAAAGWTGFYGGLNVGWAKAETSARISSEASDPRLATFIASGQVPGRHNADDDGVIGGIQVGYNWQSQNFVIGFEADLAGSTANPTSNIATNVAGVFPGSGTYTQNLEWLGTVRGRLGVLVSPDLLAYATAGFAYAQIERTYGFALLPPGGPPNDSFAKNRDWSSGWTVGGGLERAIGNRMTIGAEYLYVNLDGVSFNTSNFSGVCTAVLCRAGVKSGDTDIHVARIKLNYKF